MTELATDRLHALIVRKHECLSGLCALGRLQEELAAAEDDLGELLRLLAAKQRLLDDLQSIEQDLSPFRGDDPERRLWRSPDDRARCQQLAAETTTMLERILDQERRSMTLLEAKRDAAAAELSNSDQGYRAHQGYGAVDLFDGPLRTATQLDLTADR